MRGGKEVAALNKGSVPQPDRPAHIWFATDLQALFGSWSHTAPEVPHHAERRREWRLRLCLTSSSLCRVKLLKQPLRAAKLTGV